MDTRRKSSKRSSKQTKDVKINGKDINHHSVLCTPPQMKSCRTLYSPKPDDIDDLYCSEDSSPVLLSTQEGGRGCEVTWDWRSPNRNMTPKAKVKKSAKYKLKSISPLLYMPSKKQFRKPLNTNFFQNLQEQLADIQRRYNSNTPTCKYEDISHDKNETISDNKSEDCSSENVKVIVKQLSPQRRNSPDIHEFLKDDSFTDLLIQCSQVAESALSKESNLTKAEPKENGAVQDINNKSTSPDLFADEELTFKQFETPKLKNTDIILHDNKPLLQNNRTIRNPQIKTVGLITPKKNFTDREENINDDSFDAILSTLGDEAFFASDGLNKEQMVGGNKFTEQSGKSISSINEKLCTGSIVNKFNTPAQKSDSKSSFSRHNSMPVSPRVIGSKHQVGNSFGRHNSMPYSSNQNQRQQCGLGDKRESSESLGYNSCSPMQCTPDEIEKKRQEALKRKEAARMRKEIERKRLEAIEKLQTKAKSKIFKNCR